MTKPAIQWVPQGEHPTTVALKLSISNELLANALYDMESYFFACKRKGETPDFYSYESWENYVSGAKYLAGAGKKISYDAVEEYLTTLA